MNRKQRRALNSALGVNVNQEEQLKQQYSQLCATAGEIQYRLGQVKKEYQAHIDTLTKELTKVNGKIEDINLAFRQIVAEKQKAESDKMQKSLNEAMAQDNGEVTNVEEPAQAQG